jgi:hypothetical protein
VLRAELVAAEVAGKGASPLKDLLAERIATLCVFVELIGAFLAGSLSRNAKERPSPAYMLKMVKIQESVNRRYLAAIRGSPASASSRRTPGASSSTRR